MPTHSVSLVISILCVLLAIGLIGDTRAEVPPSSSEGDAAEGVAAKGSAQSEGIEQCQRDHDSVDALTTKMRQLELRLAEAENKLQQAKAELLTKQHTAAADKQKISALQRALEQSQQCQQQ